MRKITFLMLLIASTATSQHIDLSIGANSRLHSTITAGISYRTYNGIDFGIYGAFENKHNKSAGATVGYKISNFEEPEEGWVMYAGASHQWYNDAAKSELKNNVLPVAGSRFYGGWGYWELRYSANSFNVGFGYRFLNHY